MAFESIDGPPPQVFDRMVSVLDSESKLRDLSVVSREGSASYRVRSYLAAQVSHGRATIAWVWDVYDSNQQRALRLSGEEPAGKAGRDAWSGADDLVLRKIAQAGFSGLTAMINGTGPTDAPPADQAPAKHGPAVAAAEPAGLAQLCRQRPRLRRQVRAQIAVPTLGFAQENQPPRVASRTTSLYHLARRNCRFRRYSDMLNIVSSKARGEASMSAKNGAIKLVAGNSNPALAQAIAG